MTGALHTIRACDWPAHASAFADLTFEQSAAYAQAAAVRSRSELRLYGLGDLARPVALAAVRLRRVPGLRRGLAWCPAGPLGRRRDRPGIDASAAMAQALADRLVQAEGHLLRLRPAPMPGAAALPGAFAPTDAQPGYDTVWLDLSAGAGPVLAGVHAKWRQSLRTAQRGAARVETGPVALLGPRFMALFEPHVRAKGFRPGLPPQLHFDAAARDGSDHRLVTMIAHEDGVDLGGVILGLAGRNATYLYGAITAQGRARCSGYLLQAHALEWLAAQGITGYDMGGIDPAAAADVARFKLRMGGTRVVTAVGAATPPGLSGQLVAAAERIARGAATMRRRVAA